jgi:hypothetical protein
MIAKSINQGVRKSNVDNYTFALYKVGTHCSHNGDNLTWYALSLSLSYLMIPKRNFPLDHEFKELTLKKIKLKSIINAVKFIRWTNSILYREKKIKSFSFTIV